MKLNKSFFIAAALVGAMATSCSEDGVWDAAPNDNVAYTFNASSASYTYSPEDVMEDIDIVITRNNTNGSVTIPIAAESSDPDMVVAAEEVVFEDGSNTANCTLQILKQFEIGEEATITLMIDPEAYGIAPVKKPYMPEEPEEDDFDTEEEFNAAYDAYEKEMETFDAEAYNDSLINYNTYVKQLANYKRSTKVTIMKDYNWTSLGMGTFDDALIFDESYRVEIQQANENPSMFRLVHPYNEGLEKEYTDDEIAENPSDYVKFQILKAGDVLRGVTLKNDGLVYYNQFNIGIKDEDYNVAVSYVHPSAFASKATEESWSLNTVKSYQENGLPAVVQFAPFYYMNGVGGYDYSVYTGVVTITFPGVKVYDYESEIVYSGRYIDADNVEYVLADVTLGADVKKARIVIVPGKNNIDDAYAGVLNGSLKYVEVDEDGQVQIPMLENAATGKYTIALLAYGEESEEGKDAEIVSYNTATFDYVGAGAPEVWNLVGIGDYIYTLFFTDNDGSPLVDEGLELYQSEDDPTRYKIEHWAYDVDFVFTMDEEGNILVEDQETGYVDSEYGMIYVDDLVDYTGGTKYGTSYYNAETKTFKFAVVYYDVEDAWNYGYETFTLNSSTETKARSAKESKKTATFTNRKHLKKARVNKMKINTKENLYRK
ncbi:MAG: hypothetical protein J1F40_05325 [Prevotellaceae bacterium]|nr:hypothetical protein [Prevotellaceae bacterium]